MALEGSAAAVEVVPAVDYAGVPTAELVAVYAKYGDCDLATLASRLGWREEDVRQTLVTQKYSFTGWTKAEAILKALDLSSSMLLLDGDLHQIPARNSRKNARKIALDELADELEQAGPPPEAVLTLCVAEIMTRREAFEKVTDRQRAQLDRDSAKAQARQQRLKLAG